MKPDWGEMTRELTPDQVTVVIPAHTPRVGTYLHAALDSVLQQRHTPDAIVVEIDRDHRGAAETRNRGLSKVTTQWVAFLDSDDRMGPDHLAELMDFVRENPSVDLVYPWFTVENGFDPFPQYEGAPFDPAALERANFIPITVLARTWVIRDAGGFQPLGPPDNPCDDHGCWKAMLADGAKFAHLNRRTWTWRWHRGETDWNTSGRGDVW